MYLKTYTFKLALFEFGDTNCSAESIHFPFPLMLIDPKAPKVSKC